MTACLTWLPGLRRAAMNNLLRSSLAVAVLAASLAACTKDKATTAEPSAPAAAAENPSQPVAKFNGQVVTLKEVDATIASQLKQMEKQKLELRQQGAEQFVLQALVKVEASKVGQTEDQWLKANVDGKLPQPAPEKIKEVWEQNKDKMPPGSTMESMHEQIVAFLGQDARKAQALKVFDELKQKAGYQLLLEEPRVVVEVKGPGRGPATAKVTIVEFSDFECPFCSRAEEAVTQVMDTYAGKVHLVFRHFPLSFHANAQKAAEAAACAEDQNKFWEMHKQLFANQQKLAPEDLKAHAAAIGLDAAKFAECLDMSKNKAKVDADQKAGADLGVNGTPAFFINGKLISGAQPFSEFQKIIDAELAKGG
jgi:protein-disulfide isomerase